MRWMTIRGCLNLLKGRDIVGAKQMIHLLCPFRYRPRHWAKQMTLASPLRVICVLILVAACASVAGAADHDYMGAQGCMPCHESIHDAWQKTRHAGAMNSLASDKNEENATCLPCHSTGYGDVMGYLDQRATPELAGVQCESCHGHGKAHAGNPSGVRTSVPRPEQNICRKCHTVEQDSAFDYAVMSKKVH